MSDNVKQYREIPLAQIDRDPAQPRRLFDDVTLEALAESIRQEGVLQPVEVSAQENGRFLLHHGERRWRAAKLAGLTTIPAIIAPPPATDVERLVRGMVENMLREDLRHCRQVSMREIDDKPFWFPLAMGVARLFAPVL